ncbi:MAG: hypothetical protein F6K23_21145 [Okeania sp. SIO2C9]|uniref:hypothetical protein n=1 Tax=Okeania sp. SIO2C9 TaxID=2607791 RepID=UPI0013C1E290|nr:hypothetical protein [Okeania sp. SIO2C9]NEQ75332.1 hypothetical protein [Okeania sp. SIO2C9]
MDRRITFKEMKTKIPSMMDEVYGGTTPNIARLNDASVEDHNFLLEQHSAVVRKFCQQYNCHISFRAAGEDSLDRIKNGNPCKGHDIMDKSIKQKGRNWTYKAPSSIDLENYKGLVGYRDKKDEANPPYLLGLWYLDDNGKSDKKQIDSVDPNQQTRYFTGDYDLHDLFRNKQRVLSSVDERHDLDILALRMIDACPSNRKDKFNSQSGRAFESPYSLVRHGAQTNFISFLLSHSGEGDLTNIIQGWQQDIPARLPLEGAVTTIDDNVIMYDPQGQASFLDSLEKVYHYYQREGLLAQIPFYFFIANLKQRVDSETDKDFLNDCSRNINQWLKKCYPTDN